MPARRHSRWVCRSIFVTRFLSTNRRSLGSIGFPQAAQMTVFGFLKNMSASLRPSLVESEQSARHRPGDQLRHVLLHR